MSHYGFVVVLTLLLCFHLLNQMELFSKCGVQ